MLNYRMIIIDKCFKLLMIEIDLIYIIPQILLWMSTFFIIWHFILLIKFLLIITHQLLLITLTIISRSNFTDEIDICLILVNFGLFFRISAIIPFRVVFVMHHKTGAHWFV